MNSIIQLKLKSLSENERMKIGRTKRVQTKFTRLTTDFLKTIRSVFPQIFGNEELSVINEIEESLTHSGAKASASFKDAKKILDDAKPVAAEPNSKRVRLNPEKRNITWADTPENKLEMREEGNLSPDNGSQNKGSDSEINELSPRQLSFHEGFKNEYQHSQEEGNSEGGNSSKGSTQVENQTFSAAEILAFSAKNKSKKDGNKRLLHDFTASNMQNLAQEESELGGDGSESKTIEINRKPPKHQSKQNGLEDDQNTSKKTFQEQAQALQTQATLEKSFNEFFSQRINQD